MLGCTSRASVCRSRRKRDTMNSVSIPGRISFTASYAPLPDAMVYSAGSAVRDDVSGPGTWAFLPAQLAGGNTIVVNAGFVQNTMQDRAQQDRVVRRLITGDPVQLTGYIRFPESAGTLTPTRTRTKQCSLRRRIRCR